MATSRIGSVIFLMACCLFAIATARAEDYCDASVAHTHAVLWRDVGFKNQCVRVQMDIPDLRSYGFNDAPSSAYVPQGRILVLYEHMGYRGVTFTIEGPAWISDFRPWGWNDLASSARYLKQEGW